MTPDPKGNQPTVLETDADESKIEAVAGSGKTTTMVWRLKKEITENGCPPNRLLVLTFAKEASHNIQERLEEELDPGDAFEVDVHNYHSFCYRLLQEYAYHQGLSPDFELITEERRSQIIESVYDDVNFSFVAPGSPADGGGARSTLDELQDFIERMRREAVAPSEIEEYLPSDSTIQTLVTLVDDLYDAAEATVNIDANDLMWDDGDLADECSQLARVYRSQAASFSADPEFESLVSNYLYSMGDIAASVSNYLDTGHDFDWQDYKLPETMFQDDRNTSSDVKQTPYGRLHEFAHMLRRARAYLDAYDAYLSTLDDRGALDYDELIHRAVQLFDDGAIQDDILSQWDMVFCDEFQDTDESQRLLVDALRDDMQIMVIGDSDQAIHEWRGQDPENMSKLPTSFEEIGLPLNFRSRQPILDMTNHLDRNKQEIKADRDPAPPNIFKVDSSGQQTVEQVDTTISHLLTGRFDDLDSTDLSEIAVLVRRNRQAQKVADQLDDSSIPYSLSGTTSDELSMGLQTVLSYLRILVTPSDDISWQRVLLLLYRVPESDIEYLHHAGDTIVDGYESATQSKLARPDRVQQAFEDYEELRSVSATHSISELYMHLKQETKIEWFLTNEDRDALSNIDQLISSFSDSPIQSRLTEDVVTYLETQANQLSDGGHTATEQGSQSEDAVDIMTVHQAKGLDFDTVLLPFLTEEGFASVTLSFYQENLYKYDMLVNSISGEVAEPLRADRSDAQIAEEWRILHVAITRAKNRLFVFGNNVRDGKQAANRIDRHLRHAGSSQQILWSSEGPRMRVWEALMDSYDTIASDNSEAVRDYTDIVNRDVDADAGNITFYGNSVSTSEAIENLLDAATEFVEGSLPDDSTDTSGFVAAPLGEEPPLALARQHSHSALEALQDCERRHVLDYVVDAFPDPQSTTPGSAGARQRAIGTLLHDIAELAYWRGYTTADEWKRACDWVSDSEETAAVLDETKACIDAFFETPAAEWEPIGAEVPVDLDAVDGVTGAVTGYIDSVREHPDGGLAVLDYKTSREQNSIEESQQLILYVKACQERFRKPVSHAGYVYVGDAGPDVQLFDVPDLEARWDNVVAKLQAADSSAYANATAGPHCEFCEHQSLGCPAPGYEYEDAYDVN